MSRFVGSNNALDRDRVGAIKRRAEACQQSVRRFQGDALFWEPPADCFGFDVANDAQYHVEYCTSCATRRDVTPDGVTLRAYLDLGTIRGVGIIEAPDFPDTYTPRFDGIDAFGEAEDHNPGNPIADLFDPRGDVGDEY